jgi:hypothetical protein
MSAIQLRSPFWPMGLISKAGQMFHGSLLIILFFLDFPVIPPVLWRGKSKLLVDENIANTRYSVLFFF